MQLGYLCYIGIWLFTIEGMLTNANLIYTGMYVFLIFYMERKNGLKHVNREKEEKCS